MGPFNPLGRRVFSGALSRTGHAGAPRLPVGHPEGCDGFCQPARRKPQLFPGPRRHQEVASLSPGRGPQPGDKRGRRQLRCSGDHHQHESGLDQGPAPVSWASGVGGRKRATGHQPAIAQSHANFRVGDQPNRATLNAVKPEVDSRGRSGFTLVELLVVIGVVVLILLLAIP
ncbi:MAG: prepilin-type N-terminal cleavage/methylation domain-containing protein [Verrucomicrobia bacterium]|nr:prepilin-type N-terminal cleavage/methylation domain-containing protein [Verrucomicrobiota bacterium]